MGEAKRRKALGLMPTVHPFEAQMDADGNTSLVRGPQEAELVRLITDALHETQLAGAAWASEFRGAQVLSGRVAGRVATVQDVEAIAVAPLRRVTGELALGKDAADVDGVAIAVPGGLVRLREQRHSFDGQRWETFAAPRNPQQFMQVLQGNPAFALQGEVIGQIQAEHWFEGRIDLEPDPPEDLLEVMEDVVRDWHGETPADREELHRELGGAEGVPVARRTTFELRRPAPLQSPLSQVFAIRRDVEFFPLQTGAAFTLNGEDWVPYDPDHAPDDDQDLGALGDLLSGMMDVETVSVTVHADGRVEWDDADLPAALTERVRTDLLEATGAGDADRWAEWTEGVLTETFAEELLVPQGVTLPVPVAVRLDVPRDALDDPDPLAQTFMESEVTFDGVTWRDLFGEELPPELQSLHGNEPN